MPWRAGRNRLQNGLGGPLLPSSRQNVDAHRHSSRAAKAPFRLFLPGRSWYHETGMPLTTDIDSSRRVLLTRISGVVSAREILDHYDRVAADVRFDPTFSELLDLTELQGADLEAADIRQLAARTRFAPTARRAVVAGTGYVFGLARMFASYREGAGGRDDSVMVFSSEREAMRWLGIDPT